jgi:hypothetical protein
MVSRKQKRQGGLFLKNDSCIRRRAATVCHEAKATFSRANCSDIETGQTGNASEWPDLKMRVSQQTFYR